MEKDKLIKMAEMTEKMAEGCLLAVESVLKEVKLNKDISTSLMLNASILALSLAAEAKARGIMPSELLELDREDYSLAFEDANRIAKFIFDEVISKKNPGITLVEMKPDEEKENGDA